MSSGNIMDTSAGDETNNTSRMPIAVQNAEVFTMRNLRKAQVEAKAIDDNSEDEIDDMPFVSKGTRGKNFVKYNGAGGSALEPLSYNPSTAKQQKQFMLGNNSMQSNSNYALPISGYQ